MSGEALVHCRELYAQNWDHWVDHLARFEVVADLYYARFRRLCPGKSDALRDSGSEENQELFRAYGDSFLLELDAVLEIVRLRRELESAKGRIEELENGR